MVVVQALHQQGSGEVRHCPESAHHTGHTRQEEACRDTDVFLSTAFHHITDAGFTSREGNEPGSSQIHYSILQFSQDETAIGQIEARYQRVVPVVVAMTGKVHVGPSIHS